MRIEELLRNINSLKLFNMNISYKIDTTTCEYVIMFKGSSDKVLHKDRYKTSQEAIDYLTSLKADLLSISEKVPVLMPFIAKTNKLTN